MRGDFRVIRVPSTELVSSLTTNGRGDIPIRATAPSSGHVRPDPRWRTVRWISGSEAQLEVTDCGDGRYRIEDQGAAMHFLFEGFSYGSTLVCVEGRDGTLEVSGFELDARLDRVVCALVSDDAAYTDQWQRCGEQIMAAGGNWEFLFGGVFSAYVPLGQPPFERPGDLERRIEAALRDSM
jgi:hypothetical protein